MASLGLLFFLAGTRPIVWSLASEWIGNGAIAPNASLQGVRSLVST
ncbi:MAG: hypothetical protein F6J93_17225 [Oscillatoria sp. SIO1A7]|nr:hypothetical protein [Oscillatoria sp. SIO1A7]